MGGWEGGRNPTSVGYRGSTTPNARSAASPASPQDIARWIMPRKHVGYPFDSLSSFMKFGRRPLFYKIRATLFFY